MSVQALDHDVPVLHVELLPLCRGGVEPLPVDVPAALPGGVRAGPVAAKHPAQRGGRQLGGDLPDAAPRVVAEEEEPLLRVQVERGQQPVGAAVRTHEGPREVLHRGGHRRVHVLQMVDLQGTCNHFCYYNLHSLVTPEK